jgi:DNA-binding MarR family transcriptional regulator
MPQTTIPYEVWRIGRRLRQLLDTEFLDLGITAGEYALYSLLRAGPMTPSEVSRRSGMPATTVSKALQRIEDRGHLSRARNPDDGRSTQVTLNQRGSRLHTKGWNSLERVIGWIDRELADDAEHVYFALIRLDNALRAITGVATSPEERRFRPAKSWLTSSVRYEGDPLSTEEEDLVREYIDWIRWRRSEPASG